MTRDLSTHYIYVELVYGRHLSAMATSGMRSSITRLHIRSLHIITAQLEEKMRTRNFYL